MTNQFDSLKNVTLATIKQAQNLHVLITPSMEGVPETKLIMSKGRCMGTIIDGQFILLNEFAPGGKFHNAVIDVEIKLIKTFYGIENVIYEKDFSETEKVADEIHILMNKIHLTEDPQTKEILFNEANKIIDNSRAFEKDLLKQKVKDAFDSKISSKESIESMNLILNPIDTSESPLADILHQMQVSQDPAKMDELFDKSIELLQEDPKNKENIKIFDKIQSLHKSLFLQVHEKEKIQTKKPAIVHKPAPKKAAPAKKIAPKKVIHKSKK